MNAVINEALARYSPVKFLLLFSGGHDSLCSTHFSAEYLSNLGIDFSIYHGNTGIGIPETRQFVRQVCECFGWRLHEGHPEAGSTYEDLIRRHGFPGPASHRYMYRFLKERALRKFVTHGLKTSPHARENILLLTGIRQSESKIRMGYKEYILKEGSRIWCSPIFHWSAEDVENYMKRNALPRNPVKDKICISGECLCGAFAGREEWSEIQFHFPAMAAEIRRLHQVAIATGHPWDWASGPREFKKRHTIASRGLFMCVGCEEKKYDAA